MISLQLQFDADKVFDSIDDVLALLNSNEAFYKQLNGFLGTVKQKTFLEQKDPVTGDPWRELSERRVIERGGRARPILVWTHELFDSINIDHSSDHVTMGSNLPKAVELNFGVSSKGLPARRFIGISEADEAHIESLAEDSFFKPFDW